MTVEPSAEEIQNILAAHQPRTYVEYESLTPAAVLAPFYPTPEGLSLIFTKRTDHLDNHRGQISFPGGRRDPEDASSLGAALRETYEEIGVRPEHVQVWGRLNQEITVTRYSIIPYVGVIPYPYEFILSTDEVERLIIVPLNHLLDPQTCSVEWYPWEGSHYKTYRYPYKDDVIWGATARMVHNLLTLLTTGREPEEDYKPPLLKA